MTKISSDHPIVPIDASWAYKAWEDHVNYLYRGYVLQRIGEADYSAFDPDDESSTPFEYAWGSSPYNLMAAVNELVDGEGRRKTK